MKLKCIIIQKSECLFDEQNRLEILIIENQLPYVKIKSLLSMRTGSLLYRRRVDLKSLRRNVPETDPAHVSGHVSMSAVTYGTRQSHTVSLSRNRGLVRKIEATLCVLYIEFNSELGTSRLSDELGGRGEKVCVGVEA